MSGFSADWLTLREPYDLRARNPTVLDRVAASLEQLSSVRIVDLACGTGDGDFDGSNAHGMCPFGLRPFGLKSLITRRR